MILAGELTGNYANQLAALHLSGLLIKVSMALRRC